MSEKKNNSDISRDLRGFFCVPYLDVADGTCKAGDDYEFELNGFKLLLSLLYADDQIQLSVSEGALQKVFHVVDKIISGYNFSIFIKKLNLKSYW